MKTAIRAAALAAALSVVCLAPSAQAVNSLTPASVSVTLKPGESTTIKKSLSLDPNAAKADILIAIDTTGSMSGAINQAKSEATALVNQLQSQIPTPSSPSWTSGTPATDRPRSTTCARR